MRLEQRDPDGASAEYVIHKVTFASAETSDGSIDWYIAGVPLWVMARIIADRIQSEQWTRRQSQLTTHLGNIISFPAFEAFIQPQHVRKVEQKLKVLLAQHVRPIHCFAACMGNSVILTITPCGVVCQQAEATSGSVFHLVRIFLAPDKQSLLLTAYEPISGMLLWAHRSLKQSCAFTSRRLVPINQQAAHTA